MTDSIGFDLVFPQAQLKSALVVSLLSVWVLVGVFYYLNRFTHRRYFAIWNVAWLFYALWLTLSFRFPWDIGSPWINMVKHWCIGIAAVFLLWGSADLLGHRNRERQMGLFMAFLLVWSYAGAHFLQNLWAIQVPIFALIGASSVATGLCFAQFRRTSAHLGTGLLSVGFLLWGGFLISYPWWQMSGDLISTSFFVAAVLQLFIAVSMIVMVLEQPCQRKRVDLNALVRQVVELRSLDFERAHVEVSLEMASELPPALADPEQIQQVLVNLIQNSVQAMEHGNRPARLKLTSCEGLNGVRILVEDSGPGVPASLATCIFDQGLRILREKPIDVVVSEIDLPRVRGLELLHQWRYAMPAARIILMSGQPSVDSAIEAFRQGAFDYFVKPIDQEAIIRAVRNAPRRTCWGAPSLSFFIRKTKPGWKRLGRKFWRRKKWRTRNTACWGPTRKFIGFFIGHSPFEPVEKSAPSSTFSRITPP